MSVLRERVKAAIREILGQQSAEKSYLFGTVGFLNDDGSVLAIDSNGNQVTAFPKYPVVVGQGVVLVNDGKGAISAVPTGTRVNPTEIIHPPYFTGGQPRFATVFNEGGTIPLPPIRAHSIDFQDLGSDIVYRLSFDDLDSTWSIPISGATSSGKFSFGPNIAFSRDKRLVAVILGKSGTGTLGTGGQYKIRLYNIGSKMQSSGGSVIDQPNKIFPLAAKLVLEYTYTTPILTTIYETSNLSTYRAYVELLAPMSLFINENGTLYWLEYYSLSQSSITDFSPSPFPPPQNLTPPFPTPTGWPTPYETPTTIADTGASSFIIEAVYVSRLDAVNPGTSSTLASRTCLYPFLMSNREFSTTTGQINYTQFFANQIIDVQESAGIILVSGILPANQDFNWESPSSNLNVVGTFASLVIANPIGVAFSWPLFVSGLTGASAHRLMQAPLNPAFGSTAFFQIGSPTIFLPAQPANAKASPYSTQFVPPTYNVAVESKVRSGNTFSPNIQEYSFSVSGGVLSSPNFLVSTLFNTYNVQSSIPKASGVVLVGSGSAAPFTARLYPINLAPTNQQPLLPALPIFLVDPKALIITPKAPDTTLLKSVNFATFSFPRVYFQYP